MNFTTLSISIGIIMFCLAFNIVNSVSYDMARNNESGMYGASPLRILDSAKNYSDTGISPDPALFNKSNILDGRNAEMQQYGGYYGFTGISMASLVWDSFMKASFDLGSFIRTIFHITDANSAAYALSVFIQWGIILNHTFVLMQFVFRPMGMEL